MFIKILTTTINEIIMMFVDYNLILLLFRANSVEKSASSFNWAKKILVLYLVLRIIYTYIYIYIYYDEYSFKFMDCKIEITKRRD